MIRASKFRKAIAAVSITAAPLTAMAATTLVSSSSVEAGYCSVPGWASWVYGPSSDTWSVGTTPWTQKKVSVSSACQTHDYCYSGRPNMSRRNCDSQFLTNMRNICESRFDPTSAPSDAWDDCMSNAGQWYRGVRALGSSHYDGPQNN